MLVQYLRDKNEIVKGINGTYIRSSGRKRGVVIATGKDKVGWSMWNRQAEIDEYVENNSKFWSDNGMDYLVAVHKAEKRARVAVKFSTEEALSIAVSRSEHSELWDALVPDSILPFVNYMKARSRRFFKSDLDKVLAE